MVSASARQSTELLRSTIQLYTRIPGLPPLLSQAAHRIEFQGGSRIISRPSSEGTIRGYSKVSLLILDEASRIEEPIIAACRPMIALTAAEIVALSTPSGRRGFLDQICEHGADSWEIETIPVDQCSRITGFLADERKEIGPTMYDQQEPLPIRRQRASDVRDRNHQSCLHARGVAPDGNSYSRNLQASRPRVASNTRPNRRSLAYGRIFRPGPRSNGNMRFASPANSVGKLEG